MKTKKLTLSEQNEELKKANRLLSEMVDNLNGAINLLEMSNKINSLENAVIELQKKVNRIKEEALDQPDYYGG